MPRQSSVRKGQRFGKLLVLSKCRKRGNFGHTRWLVECDCGNRYSPLAHQLTFSKRSCCPACSRPQRGLTVKYRSEYFCYSSMKQRCLCPTLEGFKYWGGRGITVCPQWLGPGGFVQFIVDMGRRPEGTTLDRKNPEGHYCPENCRWATDKQQANNRRGSYTPEELEVLQQKARAMLPDVVCPTEYELEAAAF